MKPESLPQKNQQSERKAPVPVRFVTATSLFDGHDASINIIRRLLQKQGAEVIHLGHNRSVGDVITAAIQEDVQGIAISSYQGGHNEYFRYIIDELKRLKAPHVKVFGGGGGVIVPEEIEALQEYGVERIYHPNDGRQLGLVGMAEEMVATCRFWPAFSPAEKVNAETLLHEIRKAEPEKRGQYLGRLISQLQKQAAGYLDASESKIIDDLLNQEDQNVPVIGFSGTGGAGKSSLIDEFIRRLVQFFPEKRIGLVSIDPTQRKTGGALLGDRLRMNAVFHENVFMHSLATRDDHASISKSLPQVIKALKLANFDFIFIESAGMGQSDTQLADHVDFSLYVMTSEYGADTQLEKISMLDYADLVILNKFDKEKSEDAFRAIKKQYRRNHNLFELSDEQLPVCATIASQFNDERTNYAFARFIFHLNQKLGIDLPVPEVTRGTHTDERGIVPAQRRRYLAEIAETIYAYHSEYQKQKQLATDLQALHKSIVLLGEEAGPLGEKIHSSNDKTSDLVEKYNSILSEIEPGLLKQLAGFKKKQELYGQDTLSYQVREKNLTLNLVTESLAHLKIPKVALPAYESWGELVEFISKENIPGEFPYTAGVFPLKREGEDPIRMFAGEGNPERTNRRFHFISEGQPAHRLSTAFDSITLYGEDPDLRPDIYGKIGNAGVSICTVDDIKKLYSGFNLAEPKTSVSMTINGPAPVILAFFLRAAIDQQIELYLKESGKLGDIKKQLKEKFKDSQPAYSGDLPAGNDGLGLLFLGTSGEEYIDAETYKRIEAETLAAVRGTVQADILKEDQAQNTCIFSTEFALKMMGDMQQYFIDHDIKNFYSVSISGYHIAEAGANPITQVAFTLANGFTFIEYYLNRGMNIDKFARNLSFFFSNGMDPEYAVIGRVARRIWAIALKRKYGAGERAQKLKYHIQTSGRSLHAQEMSFNDIRTTLQALYALTDNCNSLHTNAYDEAITTPTPESVRRAIAIQMIINKELGLTKNENPFQGSYFISALTDMVENAILAEFERISERGGVLGAMETMYQRHQIQEESMYYEGLKQSGELPIMGVNTFFGENEEEPEIELMRSSEDEKKLQLNSLKHFHKIHSDESGRALERLQQVATSGGNIFAELMQTVKTCSLGQVSHALYQVGGAYRRNM